MTRPVHVAHGVRVVAHPDALEVRDDGARVVLPWRVPAGMVPGSAVLWDGRLFEVLDHDGGAWHLAPWRDEHVVHHAFPLDRAALDDAWRAQRHAAASGRVSYALWFAQPLAGFAPGDLQDRWARAYNFPAVRATVLSALIEIVPGLVGLLHDATAMAGGGFLPPSWRWLGTLGPFLLGEGIIRIAAARAEGSGAAPLIVALPWHVWVAARQRFGNSAPR